MSLVSTVYSRCYVSCILDTQQNYLIVVKFDCFPAVELGKIVRKEYIFDLFNDKGKNSLQQQQLFHYLNQDTFLPLKPVVFAENQLKMLFCREP